MTVRNVDIAIVGAGLVGQATALALAARSGGALRIALIDRNDPAQAARPDADPRASAITATSRAMLAALGAWPMLAEWAQPMREIKVTDSRLDAPARPTLLYFADPRNGGAASADMVENHRMLDALWRSVSTHPSIEPVIGAALSDLQVEAGTADILLDDHSRIRARLVVAADGRSSRVKEKVGIETVGWSYPQHGIVTTVEHDQPHDGVAEEHFLPAGPFAILPLTGNRSSLVWTEDSALAEGIVSGSDDAFCDELRRRFGTHLGRVQPVGPRIAFPLSMYLARTYGSERVVLVGDAAHSVHPIAGLGFNLGLRDAAELADVVWSAARLGLDIGSMAAIGDYQARRRFDNVLVALATDGLNRLFSNDNSAIRTLRDLGLAAVDKAQPLKRFFMAQAAGKNADLPSLMR